ncbi:porin family protein [Ferrimonas balearica]|uniref:porin family protein n=1 Tax=Ferrimonas balearica TaxID=44012 RepID=UPI001F3CB6E7|nr:porin family protein [Ferrimonas balearica]MBY6019574.1 porin family protein [Halomonas denitrificans]MBY6096640.1 porin family protein [Ferrimonas balearica]
MKRSLIALALGAAMISVPAAANLDQGYGYIGGQLNYFDLDTGLGSVNPMALTFLGGYQFNPYLALEGRIGVGVTDDDLTIWDETVSVEVDHYYAGYLVGTLPLTDWVSVYGLLGYAETKISASSGGNSADESDNDLSYGLGLKMNASENAGFTLEYIELYDDVSSLNLGFTYQF